MIYDEQFSTSQPPQAMEQDNRDAAPSMSQTGTLPIGKAATPQHSLRQLQLSQRVGARYGLDTQETVERMLSEFTVTVNRTPSMSDRRKTLQTSLKELSNAGLDTLDEATVAAELMTLMHEGRIYFEVRPIEGGYIQIRGRFA